MLWALKMLNWLKNFFSAKPAAMYQAYPKYDIMVNCEGKYYVKVTVESGIRLNSYWILGNFANIQQAEHAIETEKKSRAALKMQHVKTVI